MLAFFIILVIINYMIKNNPIGLVDSGIGGLTVVKESQKQLPNEQLIYIGDTARMPYGPRSEKEVIDYTFQMAHYLVNEQNIKMLVIACNTATARALSQLREQLCIPVIGVIQPGAEAAVSISQNKKIGLIATQGTVESQVYKEKMLAIDNNVQITSQAEPEFVTLVENNLYQSDEAREVIAHHLSAFKEANIDTLILGCTHFPLLTPFIQEAVGSDVTLVDSGAKTVAVMKQYLDELDIHSEVKHNHSDDIYNTTGDKLKFKTIASSWLARNHELDVRHLNIVGDHLEEEK
ncbi:glutamate racemase [Leuconostoc mesenteroides]|uniref:glutamate racemase n=1 Tax=Leuconostoc mesenteroides TaxID=1245 RepID=UPI00065E0CB6|nr:glutamate racemase [Leuconostoc mesenteroides]AKP36604.1 glutamate racemase [Leuconostoc mesenteroides subsp. dextranicum]ORI96098.1 glutamate racemase [Leuconostoc mesenteroides subsp. mesenteroides]QUY15834.1 glutamate racemase [Leuconostoc mesenteroides]WPK15403.1 glutamate racemase [Leuconostoc mesenteroides]